MLLGSVSSLALTDQNNSGRCALYIHKWKILISVREVVRPSTRASSGLGISLVQFQTIGPVGASLTTALIDIKYAYGGDVMLQYKHLMYNKQGKLVPEPGYVWDFNPKNKSLTRKKKAKKQKSCEGCLATFGAPILHLCASCSRQPEASRVIRTDKYKRFR